MSTLVVFKDLFKEVFWKFEYTGVEVCRKMLRYYEEPGDVELRYCELVDEQRFSDQCTAIVCMTDTDYCYVAELRGLNIRIMKKIEGEKAKLIRDRIMKISSLSGIDALNAFNSLYREVLEDRLKTT
jgi:hypothetical protein